MQTSRMAFMIALFAALLSVAVSARDVVNAEDMSKLDDSNAAAEGCNPLAVQPVECAASETGSASNSCCSYSLKCDLCTGRCKKAFSYGGWCYTTNTCQGHCTSDCQCQPFSYCVGCSPGKDGACEQNCAPAFA